MSTAFSHFALLDAGSSKVALVVPKLFETADSAATARCCIVEPVESKKLASDAELARAEAVRRARQRAEAQLHTRIKRVFLLANEPSLELVRPDASHPTPPAPAAEQETILLNAVATDRNRRPLAFYAMEKRRWQFYTRLTSYAGLSPKGFVFPAVALGQALLLERAHRASAQTLQKQDKEQEGNFLVLDIGARATGLAVFAEGVPYLCASWAFGASSLEAALGEAFSLTQAHAKDLLRTLVLSNAVLESFSAQMPQAALQSTLLERHFARKDAFTRQRTQTALSLSYSCAPPIRSISQEAAARIVASLYGSAFGEVSRYLERQALHFSRDAPVYTTGGGALVAGCNTLASHALSRCVFPYPHRDARLPARISAERIAAASALGALSVLPQGRMRGISPTSSSLQRGGNIFSSRGKPCDSVSSPTEESSHA